MPILGGFRALAGLAYACYLIAVGVRPLLGVPQEKTAGMTVATLLIYFVGALIIGGINMVIAMAGAFATTSI